MQLYISPPHPCAYLPEQEAKTLFLDPNAPKSSALYSDLIEIGFRRSGDMLYRPQCDQCQACTPVRIPVDLFRPRRIQRRIFSRVGPRVTVSVVPAEFNPDHFELFSRYIKTRHGDGEMADTTEQGYIDFLASHWCDSLFFEFRLEGELMAVAVTDQLSRGLSAVYTFFDPSRSDLSPGVFSVLWQIEECRRRRLPWLYLGYWISDCRKMSYKTDYRPYQALQHNEWRQYRDSLGASGLDTGEKA